MRKLFSVMFGLIIICLCGMFQTAAAQANKFTINFTVQLRENVSVEMGAIVLDNPSTPPNGVTILTLNGTGQTASTFEPLAQALFTDTTDSKVARMILLNYPGHGNSGLPTGTQFGLLGINDYVSALLASLGRLAQLNMAPEVLLGHSLGAEIIQLAQTRLMAQNTSLRASFGVKGAVFLVPDIAAPLPWAFVDSGAAGPLVAQFVRVDPVLGPILDIPAPVWVALFYSDRSGNIVPNATTPEEAVAKGYISFDSATMGAELIGATGSGRPPISAAGFTNSSGTVAGTIAFEQDALYAFPSEHLNLHTFITNGDDKLFFAISGPDTVHNLHVINPGVLVQPIKKILNASKNVN